MKLRVMTLVLGLALVGPAAWVFAGGRDEPGAPNVSDRVTASKTDDGVADLELAAKVAAWGRENKHPVALALAARIAGTVPQADAEGKHPKREQAAPDTPPADKKPAAITTEALLQEAKTLSGGDAAALAAVEVTQKLGTIKRGAEGGAISHLDVIRPLAVDQYMIRFNGVETAEVAIVGDGSSDLDLEVYDQNGNLIASDTDPTDRCFVRWTPRWTGPFLVRVNNLGRCSNAYTLLTN